MTPFGLHSTFQHVMNQAFSSDKNFPWAFINDIVVYSENFEEHLVHLDTIFAKLAELNLRNFFFREISHKASQMHHGFRQSSDQSRESWGHSKVDQIS